MIKLGNIRLYADRPTGTVRITNKRVIVYFEDRSPSMPGLDDVRTNIEYNKGDGRFFGFKPEKPGYYRIHYDGAKTIYEPLRVVRYDEDKALNHAHVCNAKCRSAKGDACHCECGGKYHGVSRS